MVVLALALVGVAVYGLTRIPTAFLPVEDQGYLIVPVQLPDGASKERTDAVMQKIAQDRRRRARRRPRRHRQRHLHPRQPGEPANAGVAFVVLKDWDVRLKAQGQDARTITQRLNGGLQGVPEAFTFALPPPPIQGIGNVGGFTMQVELKNGNFDYALLQTPDQRRRRRTPTRNPRCRGSRPPSGRARRSSSSRSTGSRPSGSA